jgi:methylenetetrahydrofolate dehydrogenase (NADP+)/methenyltetrahydrofolate cyclohydrolase
MTAIPAHVIDGKAIAEALRADVAKRAAGFAARHGRAPGLAVVLVGDDAASRVYVRNKGQQTEAAGMRSIEHVLPADTSQKTLLDLVTALNRDATVDGILVQLPLPKGLDADAVIATIDPAKDVDGFHAINVGNLSIGRPALVPCTPAGCIRLIKSAAAKLGRELVGQHAVVIGRSNIVGKPVAQLLLKESCTVTIAHSKTRDLPAVARQADILVVAIGQPEMVRGEWIKQGAIVIDVGINRVPKGDGKTRLVGDVAYDECMARAGAITPVPGGVGPMTIACLLANTLDAAERRIAAQ